MGTQVKTSILIDLGKRKSVIFDKVRRLEDFPRFMPDVKSVHIVERSPVTGISRWHIDVDGCPLQWTEKDVFDSSNMVIDFRTIEGDFEEFNGRWEIKEEARGIRIDFTVDYSVGIPVIEDIIGPILKGKIERNTMKMLEDLKAQIEAMHPEDERTFERVATSIRTVLVSGMGRWPAEILDLSEGGAAVCTVAAIQPNESIVVPLPHTEHPMNVKGQIVWSQPRSGRSGVKFDLDACEDEAVYVIRDLMRQAR